MDNDLEIIAERLDEITSYSFSEDLRQHMTAVGLSSSALSRRCDLTHTTVDKWCAGSAKPNSKEKMKTLGMALEMDEQTLNTFLLRNCYPALYIKNPLDCAAKLLLRQRGGRADNTAMYQEIVLRLCLSGRFSGAVGRLQRTGPMSDEFRAAIAQNNVESWFEQHQQDFCADGSSLRLNTEINDYLRLYIGDANVHELVQTGQLPLPLKNTFYEMQAGKAVNIRGLREKLIALGLIVNMTEEEIDFLLSYAGFRPLSQAETRTEYALLMALNLAHEHYPGYELISIERMKHRKLSALSQRLRDYVRFKTEQRYPVVCQMMEYYERHTGDEDRAFERTYTGWSDRNLSDYVKDVLTALEKVGRLETAQIAPILHNLRTNSGKDDDI